MLTDSRLARGEMGLLPFYAVVIETGQWWDYVDSVAPRLHELLQQHRDTMEPVLREWSVHPNFWFRRAAIIAQLPAKAATDTQLLQRRHGAQSGGQGILHPQGHRLGAATICQDRSGLGACSYVAEHESRLSPLSRREALKHF